MSTVCGVVQTAIAMEAAQEAEGARRAVADVLEGRRAIAEENITLEEQLLELRNAAAAAQQERSELESRLAAGAAEVRSAEARAAAAAERAERDKDRLREEIAALQEGRAGLMARLKEMAARKGPARGDAAAVDAASQTEGAMEAREGQREAACQASVVQDALDMARRALGEVSEGEGVTEAEERMLRGDTVSARIAEQAMADVAGLPEVSAAAVDGRDVLLSWRALMPPAGWGSGVAATVADTQHSVLESVHGLLDGLAEERAQSRATLAEKDEQIEALKAALVVVGATVPPLDGGKLKVSTDKIYRDFVAESGPRVNGDASVPRSNGAASLSAVNGPGHSYTGRSNGEVGMHGAEAGVPEIWVGAPSAVPEIQSLGFAAVPSDGEGDSWRGDDGIYYGDQQQAVQGAAGAVAEPNGFGGGSSVAGWEHVRGGGAEGVPVGSADTSPGNVAGSVQAGSARADAAAAVVHTPPPKRGWFGGIFGRRTPSPAQARRNILTSD